DPGRRQVLEHRRHAVARAAERVHVDLERDARGRPGGPGSAHGCASSQVTHSLHRLARTRQGDGRHHCWRRPALLSALLHFPVMAVRLFCNGLESWGNAFRQELGRQLAALQIAPALLPVLDVDPDPIPPRCMVLYFADGSSSPTQADLEALKKYIEA